MNYKKMSGKRVLITGANGFLAHHVLNKLLADTACDILLLCATQEKVDFELQKVPQIQKVRVDGMTNYDFISGTIPVPEIDFVVHTAFARKTRTVREMADSIAFSKKIYRRCRELNILRIVNVSSQGVYGGIPEYRSEKMAVEPSTVYTMAKYASEVLAEAYFEQEEGFDFTNLRMDSIIQSQNLVKTLCISALKDKKITLIGGEQLFSYIDIQDAAAAIVALLQFQGEWKKEYNVGWNRVRYSLMNLAEKIVREAAAYMNDKVQIEVEMQNIELYAGVDSSDFIRDTGWKPNKSIDIMISEMMRSAYEHIADIRW